LAIDINPSKQNTDPEFYNHGGTHFSIFAGDPKRIQKANEVQCKDFDAKLVISPNPISLQNVSQGTVRGVRVQFSVHNHGKKTYTLSFRTAQRWDFFITNSEGNVVYTYTDDHEFVDVVGTSMVNEDDKLVYTDDVDFTSLNIHPGLYRVTAHMENYVEMHSFGTFTVVP
jgi:hypothetical protein